MSLAPIPRLVEGPTWVFEREQDRVEVHRRDEETGPILVIATAGIPRSYQFDSMTSLINFQCDMEALLLKTGWSFVEFRPERRSGRERRLFPRLRERRRWWTDGRLPLFGADSKRRR